MGNANPNTRLRDIDRAVPGWSSLRVSDTSGSDHHRRQKRASLLQDADARPVIVALPMIRNNFEVVIKFTIEIGEVCIHCNPHLHPSIKTMREQPESQQALAALLW
jgi:hypothetical protein